MAARSAARPAGRPHLRLPAASRRRAASCAITQNDVRAIQLAKAALYAGARLLMDQLGRRPGRPHHAGRRLRQPYRRQIRHGARHDPGLRPRPRSWPAGNAAGTGARIALLNRAARAEIEAVVRRSRRSRPRSSRRSRSISSRRWRSRTRPPPSRTWPPWSNCRPRRRPRAATAREDGAGAGVAEAYASRRPIRASSTTGRIPTRTMARAAIAASS